VSRPPSWVATNAPPQVIQPKPLSRLAAACMTSTATQVMSANCPRLNTSFTGARRRSASALPAPTTMAATAPPPLQNTSASVSVRSLKENEWELRRKCSSTGQRSEARNATAMIHQGIAGCWSGA
jgi:hypothetical protein